MIIGPKDTPYENGCFIFDIYLPSDYNHVAPMVSSMTTNGGKYRYNPNLYAEGVSHMSVSHIVVMRLGVSKRFWS
jgi:ubiquitin-protein ligase